MTDRSDPSNTSDTEVTLSAWFLSANERGNPATTIDRRHPETWTEGNACRPLVHGRTYFARLYEELIALEDGDMVCFTDWRTDPDELLTGPGTGVAAVLCGVARRGVMVRGLVWRSHPDRAHFSEQENLRFAGDINAAGGEVFVDERVRRGGSHHQKLFVIRHRSDPAKDVAFVGGIDVAHGRRDGAEHDGDRQTIAIDRRYGPTPAWHDLQMEVRGPAVGDLEHTFRERWEDPLPLARGPWSRRLARVAREPNRPTPLPRQAPDPPPVGTHAVQVLRTYPAKRPAYPFAPRGERSVARAYLKAFAKARTLIYVEDQYLWSVDAADALASALSANAQLRLVVVVPAYPDEDGRVTGAANRVSQLRVLARLSEAGGERFAAYDLERDDGWPVYIHAKLCIVDDTWMMAGSDNLNRRSWTHDSELSVAIVDEARAVARNTRIDLWREHLGRDDVPVDPGEGFRMLAQSAGALDAWHDQGRIGPRPPGRLRRHRPASVAWWAQPLAETFYRLVGDPDGRPVDLRRRGAY